MKISVTQEWLKLDPTGLALSAAKVATFRLQKGKPSTPDTDPRKNRRATEGASNKVVKQFEVRG